jgi:formylglycine-generating enzyme required for sulfatase activity
VLFLFKKDDRTAKVKTFCKLDFFYFNRCYSELKGGVTMKNLVNKILLFFLLITFLISYIITTSSWAIDPVPDIKANGLDGPVTVSSGDPFSLSVQLNTGSMSGQNADWWGGVNTGGWYHYDLASGWMPGIATTHQGPLFDLNPYTVSGMSGLPVGTYTFYFAVDLIMNGSLDMDQIYYDSVKVTVIPDTQPEDMVHVPGGCFLMGDNFGDGYSDELPVHEVCLSSFYIDKYQVTQGEYQSVMGNNPSFFPGDNNRPVEQVTWYNARDYCQTVGKRLSTEAEWEYAARSGGKLEKWAGTNTESLVGSYAWYKANSGLISHPVGQKQPNDLGLYDMSGNVWEWVADWFDEDYYSFSPKNNPQGPSNGTDRVVRGGCWCTESTRLLRTTVRLWDLPGNKDRFTGFRCAWTP